MTTGTAPLTTAPALPNAVNIDGDCPFGTIQGGMIAHGGLEPGQLQANQQPIGTKIEVAIQQLQQLLQTIKDSPYPTNTELNQQILQILKANPKLLAAFIKQRQVWAHFHFLS